MKRTATKKPVTKRTAATKKPATKKRTTVKKPATAKKHATKKSTKVLKVEKDFKDVVTFLKGKDISFRFYENKQEKDYEDDLVNMLRFGLKKHNTVYQKTSPSGIIDILINNNIGIELKLYKGSKQVFDRLYRQFITYYPEPCKKLIGLIINTGRKENSVIRNEILDLLSSIKKPKKKDYKIIVKKV